MRNIHIRFAETKRTWRALTSAPLVLALLGVMSLAGCVGGEGADEGNEPPTAKFTITPLDGVRYSLDASGTTDPDGDPLVYGWNWIVGGLETDQPVAEIDLPSDAANGAQFEVSLVVRDGQGGAAFAIDRIAVGSGANTAPMAMIAAANRWVEPGDEVVLDAEAGGSYDMDGDAVTYAWFWGPSDGSFTSVAPPVEDPCAEVRPDLPAFNSGCFDEGQPTANFTFAQPGILSFHCHPHPWMKGLLVVDPNAPADPVTLPIRNFAFPAVTTVGVGATLTISNQDPIVHTVTAEHFTPGANKVDGGLFQQALDAGDYVARLVATDSKGATTTNTYGLRASDDAPENPLVESWAGQTPQITGTDAWKSPALDLSHKYSVQAVLSWMDVGGVPQGDLELFADNGGQMTKLSQCSSSQAGSTAALACLIPKGRYEVRVLARSGALHDWKASFTAVPFAMPGFGDSCGGGGGGGGGHHQAPTQVPGSDVDVRTQDRNGPGGHAPPVC